MIRHPTPRVSQNVHPPSAIRHPLSSSFTPPFCIHHSSPTQPNPSWLNTFPPLNHGSTSLQPPMTANMLALKSMRMPSATEHATNFELPSEILDLVAEILYDTTCRQLDILLPFSLVSRHFRKSALPFLFGSVSYVVRDRENQKGHELLRLLLDHPHLLRHVHTLHLLRPLDKSDRVSSPDRVPALPRNSDQRNKDLDVIDKALPLMHRLRRIRYVVLPVDSSQVSR